VPYLSALEVRSRRGAIQIHVYLYLYLSNQGRLKGERDGKLKQNFSRRCRPSWFWPKIDINNSAGGVLHCVSLSNFKTTRQCVSVRLSYWGFSNFSSVFQGMRFPSAVPQMGHTELYQM